MSYKLIRGTWRATAFEPNIVDGDFDRPDSTFRDAVEADQASRYPATANRYHLYVSLACPWAHRTLIYRHLKGLADLIDVSVVDPYMGSDGWTFGHYPGATDDRANQLACLHEVYTRAVPDFTGIVTVPVLWDRERQTIVNNESSEIIRMFNSAFDGLTGNRKDFYPELLRPEIDAINAFVYDRINNGVYRAGFATEQGAYQRAVEALFAALDQLEERLAVRRYLVGERITEADWRLFPTLVRFDAVYVTHFRCNLRRLADYPNLSAYARELYQVPGIAATVDFDHIKCHYFTSHPTLNPLGIIPAGPALDFDAPHGRERLG